MTSAKDAVLGRIVSKAVQPGARSAEYAAIPRLYRSAATLPASQMLNLFIERLRDYGCDVHRSNEASLPGVVESILENRGNHNLIVPPSVPENWLPRKLHFVCDNGLTHEELNRADGVLTGCALAIAATGTIVLAHSPSEGRRALTLIPDYHLCVISEAQVVETVPAGVRRMKAFATLPITTIAGPSATADIEMTRVKGVHGPRTLDIILVLDER
jgi:L-lactate dehydrogenase complex protein LldG